MTTLENSYCRPETVDEWVECLPWLLNDPMLEGIVGRSFVAYGDGTVAKEPRAGMTEIPITHFLDLLNDTLFAPWRLLEHGFQNPFGDTYTLLLMHHWDGMIVTRLVRVIGGRVSVNGEDVNITTFTDLLSLVRMLTPPSND